MKLKETICKVFGHKINAGRYMAATIMFSVPGAKPKIRCRRCGKTLYV